MAGAAGNKWMLVSEDGEKFEVEKRVAKMSVKLANLLKDFNGEVEMHLPVSTRVLAMVIEFCKHHVDSPLEPIGPIQKTTTHLRQLGVPEWDAKFVDVDIKLLTDLSKAAILLEIPSLHQLMAYTVVLLCLDESANNTTGIKLTYTWE